MPVLPPIPATSYDSANDVLNMARGRLNDELKTLFPVSGRLIGNNQVFVQQVFNTAWRKCQAFLAEKGYSRVTDEVIVPALPVVASLDPAVQVMLNWGGFFDGVQQWDTPALPQGFSHPLKIWERWSGQNAQFSEPMEKILDGLPSIQKTTCMGFWEWRNDTICLPGSLMVEDLRIRFSLFLPDMLDSGVTPWFQQPVPIVRVADGLAWFICAEIATARGDDDQGYLNKGEAALVKVFNLDVKADQRVNIRRQPRTGRGFGRGY